jgi:hypothetical protein
VSLAPTPPYVELKPASALRPNTRYRLDAQWHMLNGAMSETWLTFETGAGPLEQRPDAPRAVLHTYQLGRISGSSCGPMSTGTCVSVADDESYIEVSLIDALGQAQPPVLKRGSFMLLPLSAGGAGSLSSWRASAPYTSIEEDGFLQRIHLVADIVDEYLERFAGRSW